MINECIELLIKKNIPSLKGNHDSYLLGESACPRSRSASDCIAYQQSVVTPENLKWIAALPSSMETSGICAVHGGWHDYLDEYISEFYFDDPAIRESRSNVFMSGHTHVPTLQEQEGVVYCNPGSVGQPRDHDARASFAIYEDGKITLLRIKYDIDETAEKMRMAGFSDYYYKNLYSGCRIGENKTV
jgi:predicted phosphodiesterase